MDNHNQQNSLQHRFLGKGMAFPFSLTPTGKVAMSEGTRKIEESIYAILMTKPGERLMRPDFGCRIHELMFAENNGATHARIKDYVFEALSKWERRIILQEVQVRENGPDAVHMEIKYMIRDTNSYHNIVYPFYLSETGASAT